MFRRIALIPSLAALLVVVLTVNLGAWQLRRANEKEQLNAQKSAAQLAAPLDLNQITPAQTISLDNRYTLTGIYDDKRSVFLDNRTQAGVAGLYVFTPLRLIDESYVLVNRGWIARPNADRTQLPRLPESQGEVTLIGLAQTDVGRPPMFSEQQVRSMQNKVWAHIDLQEYAVASGLGANLRPYLIRQSSETKDGLSRVAAVQHSDIDKHLGYAFQWFALAFATLITWLYFSLIRPKQLAPAP